MEFQDTQTFSKNSFATVQTCSDNLTTLSAKQALNLFLLHQELYSEAAGSGRKRQEAACQPQTAELTELKEGTYNYNMVLKEENHHLPACEKSEATTLQEEWRLTL